MRYEARHEPCGTAVAEELPDGYPVREGVGLWCPACREAFWSVPPAPEPKPGVEAAPAAQVEARGAQPPRPRRVLLRVWPVLALIAVPALVVLAVVAFLTSGDDEDGGGAGGTVATATATAAPTTAAPPIAATARPAATATAAARGRRVARRVDGVRVSVATGPRWRVRMARRRLVADGPGAARVTVSAGPRRGRSLARLERNVRAALPGPAARSRAVTLGGRRAVRITGAGREVTVLVLGRRRWVVVRDVAGGGRAVARSVRVG